MISSGLVEDFLEGIEHLPLEIQMKLEAMRNKDMLFEEKKKRVHKYPKELLKPSIPLSSISHDHLMQTTMGHKRSILIKRQMEASYGDGISAIEEKIRLGTELRSLLEYYCLGLDAELGKWDTDEIINSSSTSMVMNQTKNSIITPRRLYTTPMEQRRKGRRKSSMPLIHNSNPSTLSRESFRYNVN